MGNIKGNNLPKYAKYFKIPIEIIHWDIKVGDFMGDEKEVEKFNNEVNNYTKNGEIGFIFSCNEIFKDYFNHFRIGETLIGWYNSNDITRTSFFLINEKNYTNLVKKAKFNVGKGVHILDTL